MKKKRRKSSNIYWLCTSFDPFLAVCCCFYGLCTKQNRSTRQNVFVTTLFWAIFYYQYRCGIFLLFFDWNHQQSSQVSYKQNHHDTLIHSHITRLFVSFCSERLKPVHLSAPHAHALLRMTTISMIL